MLKLQSIANSLGPGSTVRPAAYLSHRFTLWIVFALLLIPVLAVCGCRKSAAKHYAFQGEVVAADPAQGMLVIKEDEIPGYMSAMTMSYAAADPSDLRGLQPGDFVKGELVVSEESTKVRHIALVKNARPAEPAASLPRPEKKE